MKRKFKTRLIAWIVVLCVATAVLIGGARHYKRYFIPDNFGTVAPGRIYRSGQLHPRQLEKMATRHNIRTILRTNDPLKDDSEANVKKFEDICREHGIEIVQIPMYGDGVALPEEYEAALAVLTAEEKQPVLVCCARGAYRTGAIVAIYRVLEENWTIDQAFDEMEEYKFKPYSRSKGEHRLLPHLMEYFETKDKFTEEETQ